MDEPDFDTPDLKVATYLALSLLNRLDKQDAHDNLGAQQSLIGHFCRVDGLTDESLVAELSGKVHAHILIALRGALLSDLTPMAEAALRMATEHPDLEEITPRKRLRLARDYLPA